MQRNNKIRIDENMSDEDLIKEGKKIIEQLKKVFFL